ncbi:MAG TPA: hypothetical protein G4N96_11615 [Chloroflexi bacterium]|nr:hypothetical protein [Chloroflexota bacterium]
MPSTQQLYQLQQFDSQIDASNKRLNEIASNLVETEALKLVRKKLKAAETARRQTRAFMTDLDLEVKGLQQKITRHERRLYSGKLVNPKEAASLQEEIASTKRWQTKREEDLLEAMIALEEAEAAYQAAQQAYDETKSNWKADQADLLREQGQLQAENTDLSKARKSTTQFIDGKVLTRYEQLRKKKGGIAVAAIEDGSCLTCGVILSSRLCQQARTDDSKLYYCENCGRIIHIK